jgi:hypothetical protein
LDPIARSVVCVLRFLITFPNDQLGGEFFMVGSPL